jgi:hypothetical protein
MQMSWQNVEGYSGATAVGAVVLVDLILIANAFADNLFPVINDYAKTATWAIVVAIPLLSLTYLLGLVCMGTAEVLLFWSCLVDGRALTNDAVAVTARGELVTGVSTSFGKRLNYLQVVSSRSLYWRWARRWVPGEFRAGEGS